MQDQGAVVLAHDLARREAQPGCHLVLLEHGPGMNADLVRDGVPQACRRVERHQLAAVDDRDAVGQLLGLIHEVRREQHGRSARPKRADDVPGVAPRLRVHGGGRLVEEDQLRSTDQRQRQAQALLLAARQLAEARARHIAQLKLIEQRVGILGVGIEGGEQAQRLGRRDLRKQPALLQHQADARLERRALAHRVEAQDADGALVWLAVALEDLNGRGLACAVRAKQGEDLAWLDRERQLVHHAAAAVHLDEIDDLDRAGVSHCRSPREQDAPSVNRAVVHRSSVTMT